MPVVIVLAAGLFVMGGIAVFAYVFDHQTEALRRDHTRMLQERQAPVVPQVPLAPTPPPAPALLPPAPPPPASAVVERADLLAARATAFSPVVRSGRVSAITGDVEGRTHVAERCQIEVWPVARLYDRTVGWNCRIEVFCGENSLYGPYNGPEGDEDWGWARCGVRDGAPTYASDFTASEGGGDPRLEMRLPENRVVISDGEDPGYRIDIRLDPEPRSAASPPRTGPFAPLDFDPVVAFGSVASSSGYGVSVGEPCSVEVWALPPTRPDLPVNGRVSVHCGSLDLYGPSSGARNAGGWGWVLVGVRDGRPTRAFDREPSAGEEDPRLELDLDARRVVVSENDEERVVIRLER